MGWTILGVILLISAALNAIQVAVVHDSTTQIYRGTVSVVMMFLAALSFRKGMAQH
jgi:hypothetical protein